jgi:hypothetical protein
MFDLVLVQFNAEAGLRGNDNASVVELERFRDDIILIIDSGDALLGFLFRRGYRHNTP